MATLSKIILENFMGVDHLEVEFGQDTTISGHNGEGKSTLAHAYHFVNFGTDLYGSSDVERLKPVRNGIKVRQVETSVTQIIDGVSYTRKLIEKWPKKRGESTAEFAGNKQEFVIDGEPMSKGAFNERIKEVFGGQEVFKMLTDPYYVASMDWKKRRELIVGENVAVEAISLELTKKKFTLKELKKLGEDIPTRIDELNNQVTEAYEGDIDADIEDVENYLEEQRMHKGTLLIAGSSVNPTAISNKQTDLNVLNDEKTTLESAWKKDRDTREGILRKSKSDANDAYSEVEGKKREINNNLMGLNGDLGYITKSMEDLKIRAQDTISTTFEENVSCPTCGQDMPEGEIEASRERFNTNRAEQLEEIKTAAGENNAKKPVLENLIAEADKELAVLGSYNLNDTVLTFEKELHEILLERFQCPDDLFDKIKAAQDDITSLKEAVELDKPDTTDIDNSILASSQRLDELKAKKTAIELQDGVKERMTKLNESLVSNGKEVIECEKEEIALEAALVAEIKKAESAVNVKFQMTTFKLFHDQVNGGVSECCIPMIDGVEYGSLNTALQIDCGLDIINTLSGTLGKSLPVWVDRAESSCKLLDISNQIIKLVVVKDRKLTVEIN